MAGGCGGEREDDLIETVRGAATATPAFVRGNSAVPQSAQTSVAVAFPAAQAAANLNVVIVGWGDAVAHTIAISDSRGNTYQLAVGPTLSTAGGSPSAQSIYYAKNIASGTNSVTATFSPAAAFVDMRVLEYSGIDTVNPLDVAVAGAGVSKTSSSGAVTTTFATDLLVAGNDVATKTTGAGTGFTQRIKTSPNGDIAQDRVVTAVGSYTATAPLSSSGDWVMQMVAFRAATLGGGDTTPPTAPSGLGATAASFSQVNLAWTAATDTVGVTGYLIERCTGTGCTSFAQVGTATGTTFNSTGLTATTSYSYRVRATDAAGNLGPFSNIASATTPAAPDTTPPGAPTGLTATAVAPTQISLAWTAATDNVGVTGYRVERCAGASCTNFAQVATPTGTTVDDAGLTAASTYRYRVRATDAAGNLGAFSAIASATTPAVPDTTPPGAPSGLAATVISGSQINLAWTAATDNVGVTGYVVQRCTGVGCTVFAQVATPTTTTFNDIGLAAATSYSYQVRATDGAGNLGPFSGIAAATTTAPDTTPPTAPSGLAATVFSGSQINLAWTAATDNAAVTGYQIERCAGVGCGSFAQIGTSAGVTFPNTGLSASTSYSYRVRATDAAGNLGAYSNAATAVTPSPPTAPAFVQANYAVPQSPQTTVVVPFAGAQTAGNLNVVVVGWADAVSHAITVTDSRGNPYTKAVGPTLNTAGGSVAAQSIYYAANIVSAGAGANSVTVGFGTAADWADIRILEYSGVDPSNPVDAVVAGSGTNATSSSGALTTTAPNALLVAGNDVATGTSAAGNGFTSRAITNPDGDIVEDRLAATAGSYTATATLFGSGTWVMQMVAFRAVTGGGGPDTQAPTAPGNLTATVTAATQIDLAWTVATDNIAVTSYLVERCVGSSFCTDYVQIGTATGTSFSNTGLASGTRYRYRVRATDAAGNLGPYSTDVSAITPVADPDPPTAPSALEATVPPFSVGQINLAWIGSTDNVGVANYRIERCVGAGCGSFTQIATATGITYNDTGLAPGTIYSYRVRAADTTGNTSGYSNTASAATAAADTQAPTTPSGLTATLAPSGSQIDLAWTASTDNVAVINYRVERCTGAGCSAFAEIGTAPGATFSNTGLVAGTSYSYRVRAADAAGNTSGYSNTAGATTPGVAAVPAYVQGNYAVPQTPQTTVAIPFPGAQGAGHLNVVIVGWSDSSTQVASVSDSAGNAYLLAVGPTVMAGVATQSIYYAKNIAAAPAGNVVTVTYTSPASYPDIRIAQYSGVHLTDPVDATAAATGTSTASSTPTLTTTGPNDLLVAGNLVMTMTTGPGSGFTQRILTNPDGDILEDRLAASAGAYAASAPLSPSTQWIMQTVAFRAGVGAPPPPPDTTPPTVAVTSPASGATVSGTINVVVTASDNAGVAGVALVVDGMSMGAPDTTSPYSFPLDTTKLGNGSHTIGAYAWDPSKNLANAAGVAVTFSNANPANPAVVGLWSGLRPLPLVPVNVALMSTGKVLMYDGGPWGTDARVWDPTTNTLVDVPAPVNIFCSSLEQLGDGRILVNGGHPGTCHIGLTANNVFDPVTGTWTVLADMAFPRWYPTSTTLPDGRVLVMSGESTCQNCFVSVHEIYNPATNTWQQLSSPAAQFSFPYYPHPFVLPTDGRVLVTSTTQRPIVSQVFDLNTLTWTAVGGPAVEGGAAVMYRPSKFLKMGLSVESEDPVHNSTNTAYVLDMTQASPTWRQVASMANRRAYHNATMLPDGSVLVTGGGPTTAATNTSAAILPAELWSPTTETWTTLSSMNAPRLYHSEALLMPDGRVLISGGGRSDVVSQPTDQLNSEFYSPPYLFKGPRPVITSAPTTVPYNQTFVVQTPNAPQIAQVSLIRLGAVTHSVNASQRFVPLAFTTSTGSLTVTAPASNTQAPVGYYMLFIVDTAGVPSVAAIVRL